LGSARSCRELEDCVFCAILAGRSPASVFYEDELGVGFLSTGLVTTGHALIVPRGHATLTPVTGRLYCVRMLRVIVRLLPLAILLLAGCSSMFKAPSVKVRGVDIVSSDELGVYVTFYNPNRFAIDIADMEYRVFIDTLNCGTGRREPELRLASRDSTTAAFPLQIDYGNLGRALPNLMNDSVEFRIMGDYRLPKVLGKRKLSFKAGKKTALKAKVSDLLRGWFK